MGSAQIIVQKGVLSMTPYTIIFGSRPITIEDVVHIARRLKLWDDEAFVHGINQGPLTLEKLLMEDHIIDGVNTGYMGAIATSKISKDLTAELLGHSVRFHHTGIGEHFDEASTRALRNARIVSLTKGFSAVRLDLLNQLVTLLQRDILQMVPQEGSVTASGDLIPLSYVAAVLCGEREVKYNGQVQKTSKVFQEVSCHFIHF